MEPEIQPLLPEAPPAEAATETTVPPEPVAAGLKPRILHWLIWTFIGNQGLRAGWSVLLFLLITVLTLIALASAATFFDHHILHHAPVSHAFTAANEVISEAFQLLALLAAGTILAFIERRRLLDYNLTGPRPVAHFFSGLTAGFAALSVLVGALSWGGWLHFGPVALSGAQIIQFGAAWAAAFLLVGCCEEGLFRCFLQFTFTRGINFWWAFGTNAAACLLLALLLKGNGLWGVYAIALLGLFPCLMLHIRKTPRSGFWQAAWVTSTLFGLIHTGNGGENWIGIFAAAFIGFVFCVSIRVTGSAWWAIGCHAAWDWAETFFYGTADSGYVAPGHYLTATPAGNALWSGGTDGPEGSLLVLVVVLLLLAALLAIYGRNKVDAPAAQ